MNIYPAGPYNVEVEVYGTGPFKARGLVRSIRSGEVLRCVETEIDSRTKEEATAVAIRLAEKASIGIPFDRRHVD